MACVSDVGQWHLTHSAVPWGSRAMNCSSTTRSTTSSTSRGSAMSHLRQVSWSCWAITNGRPLSPSSTDRKRFRCCSGLRPTRCRMAHLRSSGHPVDPSSSAGRGRWMGLRQGCPSGQASSGEPAGLHPALGPTRGSDPPAPASCLSAPGVVFGEDQRETSLAPQVALVELAPWRHADFLVPGFGTSVARFKIGWKDEEVRGGEQTVSLMTF